MINEINENGNHTLSKRTEIHFISVDYAEWAAVYLIFLDLQDRIGCVCALMHVMKIVCIDPLYGYYDQFYRYRKLHIFHGRTRRDLRYIQNSFFLFSCELLWYV